PLPAGPYREFRTARRRADLVLGESREEGSEFGLVYVPRPVLDSKGSVVLPGDADLLTAIARPERLVEGVARLGFRLERERTLPDHDPLDAPDLLAGFDPGRTILTTPKDWVKLSLRPEAERYRWGIVHREARIGPPERFAAWLESRV
ncbi:hypothetical protein EON77_03440, partial [bacterium]